LKIVLDTNVLVSAFLKPHSNPARILHLIIQGDIQIVVNEAILSEYREVLLRPKFSLQPDAVQMILDHMRSNSIKAPALPETFRLPDKGDEVFLEAALSAGAEALITGNKKHFPKGMCFGQTVLTPQEFLQKF